MNFDALAEIFLRTLVYNLPAMVLMIVGMIWTHSTWQRHPPAARLAMFAFVWMFITYVLAICWHTFGVLILLHFNLPPGEQTPYLIALSCCEAAGYLLFMLALNAARYPYRSPQYYEHFEADEEPPRPS